MFDEYCQAALDWANEVRTELGLEPVEALEPGARRDARVCPVSATIAKGSDYEVTSYETTLVREPCRYDGIATLFKGILPSDAFTFISRFDNRFYPELEANPDAATYLDIHLVEYAGSL